MTSVDPITLEVVSEGFIAIVREMRATVTRTAYSSAVYELDDFSKVWRSAGPRSRRAGIRAEVFLIYAKKFMG